VSIEALHDQLRAAIESIETGAQWQSWLEFARRLHQYSFNNLLLIWAQRPSATAVASYRTWQGLDRQVRRGEKALRVMAPITRNVAVTDDHGQPVNGADGRPQRRHQVVGFRPAPVFDLSQTDGPPVPEPQRPALLTGQAPAGLRDALAKEVAERGYRLLRSPLTELNGANGVTRVDHREVWVRDDVDDAQAAKTLAHELAHVILHAQPGEADHDTCAGIREVEAESVAHLIMAIHQVDTGAYTFPYVAIWAYPLAAVEHVPMADIVARTGSRVLAAAREILDATSLAAETPDPATLALTSRVSRAAQQAADLREDVAARVLPHVDRDVLLGVVADSQDFFRRHLTDSWVPSYLADRRLASALHSHQLGYAPKAWTLLTDHLRSLGYTDDHIEAAGMATRARNGHLIDRFRDRLTIPLRNDQAELVGFAGRVGPHHADSRGAPKYLNTPTTALFRKSELLYGLDEHRLELANGHLPVLCEGPLDAIAVDLLANETRTNLVGVAASGTAFSDSHARQLLALVGDSTVCLALDGDPAGRTATQTVWRTLTGACSRDVRVAQLPAESDPASLFSADPETLAHCLQAAGPAGWVIVERRIDDADIAGNVAKELLAFRELVDLAARMPPSERTEYVLRLAEKLRIEPAEAAIELANRCPDLLMDQVLATCGRVGQALHEHRQDGLVPASSPNSRTEPSPSLTIRSRL